MGDDDGGTVRRKVDVGLLTLILTMLVLLGQNIWRESRDAAEKEAMKETMREERAETNRMLQELTRAVTALQVTTAELRTRMDSNERLQQGGRP